jgi:hypothetical protein
VWFVLGLNFPLFHLLLNFPLFHLLPEAGRILEIAMGQAGEVPASGRMSEALGGKRGRDQDPVEDK